MRSAIKKVLGSYILLIIGVALIIVPLTLNLFVEPEPVFTESLLYIGFLITLLVVLVKLVQLEARLTLLIEREDRTSESTPPPLADKIK